MLKIFNINYLLLFLGSILKACVVAETMLDILQTKRFIRTTDETNICYIIRSQMFQSTSHITVSFTSSFVLKLSWSHVSDLGINLSRSNSCLISIWKSSCKISEPSKQHDNLDVQQCRYMLVNDLWVNRPPLSVD